MTTMSKTDKTMSTGAFERREGVQYWWDSPLANGRWCLYGLPSKGLYRPPTKRGESRAKKAHLRQYWGGERSRVRMALLRGEEPEPTRTQRTVLWDMT